MIDAGDEKEVKKGKSKDKLRDELEVEQFRVVLQTYEGRAFMWRLISCCGLYDSAYGETNDVFRAEGKRDIALWVINEMLRSYKSAYTLMRDEAVSRDTKK